MASEFDETDFLDGDFRAAQKSSFAASSAGGAGRPPTREELDSRVTETQQRLMELKRAQEELERERAALEEARRRRTEFQTGREEMLQSLTRGVVSWRKASSTRPATPNKWRRRFAHCATPPPRSRASNGRPGRREIPKST